jgi:anaerobic magnesium-protoporphyrin IX monomethyl ester cyclase
MKILLIYPYWLDERKNIEDVVVPPIGIYYVGAVLKQNNYDVEILNWHHINKTPEKIVSILREKKPDVIGFSILQANRWGGIEIAQIAKQIDPQVKVVFGGISATFLWDHFLTHFPQVDFVVIGEGEYPFLSLVRCIERGEDGQIERIRGIAFRKNGKPFKTKPAEPIKNLDDLPIPSTYFEYSHLSLTRGCPGKCNFCGSPQFWGPKVRFHSTDYFVEEIERLYKKGISFFYFSDDTFSVNKKRVIDICKKIIEKNLKISWVAISRVNYISEDIVAWMRSAGCIQISYGVESGSKQIREALNKKIKTSEIENAFSLTAKYGILPRAYFIYGCPGESRQTIRATLNLIKTIKPLVVHFFILSIFPGTSLYAALKKTGNVTDHIWLNRIEDIKYFEIDSRLTQEMVQSFGDTLKREYYQMLPEFVAAIELIDKKEFYPLHADFCSRLAMTFDHGDYADNDAIPNKDRAAVNLYRKALAYHPDSRAYLGLGIYHQKNGDYRASIKVLSKGVEHFPRHEQLNLCLGVSYMNLAAYKEALSILLKLRQSKQAVEFIVQCYRSLNAFEKASHFEKKLKTML